MENFFVLLDSNPLLYTSAKSLNTQSLSVYDEDATTFSVKHLAVQFDLLYFGTQ